MRYFPALLSLCTLLAVLPSRAQNPPIDRGYSIAADNFFRLQMEERWNEVFGMLAKPAQKAAESPEKLVEGLSKDNPVTDMRPDELQAGNGWVKQIGKERFAIVDLLARTQGGSKRHLQRIMLVTEEGKWKVLYANPSRLHRILDTMMLEMMAKFVETPEAK
jgi:hypothetical protein